MKSLLPAPGLLLCCTSIFLSVACKDKNKTPSEQTIKTLNVEKGAVVLCGPPDKQFGSVSFETSCTGKTEKDFDLAIALLHSFEYTEAEKVFSKVIEAEPGCAMAYWGVAMCNYHQLWPAPPSPAELDKGAKALAIATSLTEKTRKEADYINAISSFYSDWEKADHRTRTLRFEKAMEMLYKKYPEDKEAAIFYALALDASADPTDKTFKNQKKAGTILAGLYPTGPDHPGIVHYIIHTYDYPELASLALPAARKYASIAPSSAHAQHMPSHIFTRLGLWDEAIKSNLASTASARCYAENTGMKGHWDEELHGMDYLVYAYLQRGENDLAKQQLDYLQGIGEVQPANFKVAYAFAAIPSRYFLENKMWKEAATLEVPRANLKWPNFPWQNAIAHFARLLGLVRIHNVSSAKDELKKLYEFYDSLKTQNDVYKANQVMIQIKSGEAWILLEEAKPAEAVEIMKLAAEMEDKTEKSPVTPGEIIPARELLADMLLVLHKPAEAREAYETDLKKHPNRFNALYGAALASEQLKDDKGAKSYYTRLKATANSPQANRPELEKAALFLQRAL